mgnify:CR=1 FL=1
MTLEIRQIGKTYCKSKPDPGSRPVLDGISLNIHQGDRVGITGSSGAGKSTLGFVLTVTLRPDKGTVLFEGINFWTANRSVRKALSKKLQMVYQHPESAFDPRWTIRQSLAEPFRFIGTRPDEKQLISRLAAVELDAEILNRRPDQLSGGELQRIAIARVMILEPKVVVLDEPTAMLDVLTQAKIMHLLETFQEKTNTAYVLISHDPEMVDRFCNKKFRLNCGQLTPFG